MNPISIGLDVFIVFIWVNVFRLNRVYKYRMELIEQVHDAAMSDIEHSYPYAWRWDELNKVSMEKMTLMFWKRIRSFYPDKSFIDPTVRRTGRI